MKKACLFLLFSLFTMTSCSFSDIVNFAKFKKDSENDTAQKEGEKKDDNETKDDNKEKETEGEDNPSGDKEEVTTFTVTFNPGPHGNVVTGSLVQTVSSSDEIVPPTVIQDGYDFVGWDKEISSITSSCEVNATWEYTNTGECYYRLDETEEGELYYYVSGVYSKFHPKYRIYSVYDGYPVTEIRGAFRSCEITEVTIPESITKIGLDSFNSCRYLETVNLHEKITIISMQAFMDCSSLKSIIIPSKVSILGFGAFWNCNNLETVTLQEGLVELQPKSFANCTSLKEIRIPSTLEVIHEDDMQPFFGCNALESIIVDENNTTFHSEGNCLINTNEKTLISGCKTSIIPNDGSVTRIGNYAFEYLLTLEYLEIPESIESIGHSAFWLASINKGLVIGKGTKNIESGAFDRCFIECVFYKGSDEEEWNTSVVVESENDPILYAQKFYYKEEAPESGYRYWRYVDGVPTVWTDDELM